MHFENLHSSWETVFALRLLPPLQRVRRRLLLGHSYTATASFKASKGCLLDIGAHSSRHNKSSMNGKRLQVFIDGPKGELAIHLALSLVKLPQAGCGKRSGDQGCRMTISDDGPNYQ